MLVAAHSLFASALPCSYGIANHDGFYIVPDALSLDETGVEEQVCVGSLEWFGCCSSRLLVHSRTRAQCHRRVLRCA